MHLFCESKKVLYIDFFAVVQYGPACKTSENLMLVGTDDLYISAGGSVYDWNEVHFEAPVVAGKGPWGHIIFSTVFHRNIKCYLAELVSFTAVEYHVFAGRRGITEAIADVKAKRHSVCKTGSAAPVPYVVVGPYTTTPVKDTEGAFFIECVSLTVKNNRATCRYKYPKPSYS